MKLSMEDPVSPRLLFAFPPSIVAAISAAVWCISAGWGWLAALAAYSLTGSVVLLVWLSVAVLVETRAATRTLPRQDVRRGLKTTGAML
jgi:hypothetical protein